MTSSSFNNRSTSDMESIESRGDERCVLVEGHARFSNQLCDVRDHLLRLFGHAFPFLVDSKFWMLLQQFLTGGGAGGLSGRALHNPFGWLHKNRTNGNAHTGNNQVADFAFNVRCPGEKLFALNLCDDDDVLGSEIGIVYAHGNCATVVNRGIVATISSISCGINIFSADDEQVFLSAHDEEFAGQ